VITRAWLWLRSILVRRRLEREMDEEMSMHLQRSTEQFRAGGFSPEDARVAAYRTFGNIAAIKEDARDARGGRGIESVVADVRYGVRCLSRTPFTSLTMIVVYALGIGFNATLFLVISSLVNSPLPGCRATTPWFVFEASSGGPEQISAASSRFPNTATTPGRRHCSEMLPRGHPPTSSWVCAAVMNHVRRRSSAAPRPT
jgi:hypothetical protein